MAKLTAATKYMLASLFTVFLFAVIGCFILNPSQWRHHLLSLLSRSFMEFTAGDPSGWLVSHIYSSVFLMAVTIAMVGIVRGVPAMRRHWIETSTIAFLTLFAQIVLFYGPIFCRKIAQTVYEDHEFQAAAKVQLTHENSNLTTELRLWKTKALIGKGDEHAAAALQNDSPKKIRRDARSQASDVLEFQAREFRNLPGIVIGGPAEITRRTMEESNRYNQKAIVDFLKKFGGPVESVMRRARPYGIDPSRLANAYRGIK